MDGSWKVSVTDMDLSLARKMHEGHVVVDDAIVLGGELEEVVHVGNDQGVVEVGQRELRLANAGGSMQNDRLSLELGGVDGDPGLEVGELVLGCDTLGVELVTGDSDRLVVTHHAPEVVLPQLLVIDALLDLVLDGVQVRPLALALVLERVAPLVPVTLLLAVGDGLLLAPLARLQVDSRAHVLLEAGHAPGVLELQVALQVGLASGGAGLLAIDDVGQARVLVELVGIHMRRHMLRAPILAIAKVSKTPMSMFAHNN